MKFLFIVTIFFSSWTLLKANHIIGTDMKYECLGDGGNSNARLYRIE